MTHTRRSLLVGFSLFGLMADAHARSVIRPENANVTPPASSVLAVSVGALTASGVVIQQLPAGTAFVPGTGPADYFAIDARGTLSVSKAGDSANLGSGTYDLPVQGGGTYYSAIRVTVEADTFDVDTDAAFTAAEAATASSLTTDWTIALPPGVWLGARAFTRKYDGTLDNPNFGIGAANLIARTRTLDRNAKATARGGSLTVKSRGDRTSGFAAANRATGAFGPLVLERIDHRLVPNVDAYNAKFTNVATPFIWTPTVDAQGAVTGVASVQQVGVGYLASPHERRAYVSKKVGNTPVTISQGSPAVIGWTQHGLAANTAVTFNSAGQIPDVKSTLPAGIRASVNYYVKTVLDANAFTISATVGGAAIATTSAGSGTFLASAGIGFEGWFDVDDDGRLTTESPLTIVTAGSGHTPATAFSHYPLSETTQRALCQSNNLASRATQFQVLADSSGNVGDIAFNGCGFGTGSSGASDVRVLTGAFIRNANRAYFHDCVVNGYFVAFDIGFANDCEIARTFAVRGSNDFIDEYPAVASSNLSASQIANGSRVRIYGNGVTRMLDIHEHSNEHADFHQVAAPNDIPKVRDFCVVGNYLWGAASIRSFSNQGEMNSLMGDLDQRQYIAGNFMLFNTPNGAQLANARSVATAQYAFNTLIRFMSESIDDRGYANGFNGSVEPWVRYRGAYSAALAYALGQVVLYNGGYYQVSASAGAPAGNRPDTAGSTVWVAWSGFEMDISGNILGAIWEHATLGGTIRAADPATPDGFITAQNGSAAYSGVPFRYRAQNNAYVNAYTPNGGSGTSYPEVFSGGTAFFETFDPQTGFNGYGHKVRQSALAEMIADIDAAFTPKPGTIAAGRGHTALPA